MVAREDCWEVDTYVNEQEVVEEEGGRRVGGMKTIGS